MTETVYQCCDSFQTLDFLNQIKYFHFQLTSCVSKFEVTEKNEDFKKVFVGGEKKSYLKAFFFLCNLQIFYSVVLVQQYLQKISEKNPEWSHVHTATFLLAAVWVGFELLFAI